jgi:hypothetical protein
MAEPLARLVHSAPGRVRLRVPLMEGDPAEAHRLFEATTGLAGVSKVEARPATGSLVIFHTGPWAPLAEAFAAATGLALAAADEVEPLGANALDASADMLEALDRAARRAFGGRTDLSELAFLGLVAAGAVQAARGQLVGPATTLFSQALNLMSARRARARPR